MIFTQHKIHFNIVWPDSLFNHLRSFFDGYTIMNNSSAIFSITLFSSAFTMLQMLINSFVSLLCRSVTIFILPNPLIDPHRTYGTLTRSLTFHANQFRTPLLMLQPSHSLIFHCSSKTYQLWLLMLSLIRSALGIVSYIHTGCYSPLCRISSQLPTNSGSMNANFFRYFLLFYSGLNKSMNLMPF